MWCSSIAAWSNSTISCDPLRWQEEPTQTCTISILVYLCKNFLSEELAYSLGSYGMELITNCYTYALLALTHAEGAAKLYLLTKLILCDEVLKLLYYLT